MKVANTKFNHDARHLFQEKKALVGKNPDILITDKLPASMTLIKKNCSH
jgi:hypothetical protein